MSISPPDWVQGTNTNQHSWVDPFGISTGISMPTHLELERLKQTIAQHTQTNDKAKIQITLRPIDNGYLLTIEHKGVKHERSVMDFSEIGAQVMVALAAINLEG